MGVYALVGFSGTLSASAFSQSRTVQVGTVHPQLTTRNFASCKHNDIEWPLVTPNKTSININIHLLFVYERLPTLVPRTPRISGTTLSNGPLVTPNQNLHQSQYQYSSLGLGRASRPHDSPGVKFFVVLLSLDILSLLLGGLSSRYRPGPAVLLFILDLKCFKSLTTPSQPRLGDDVLPLP